MKDFTDRFFTQNRTELRRNIENDAPIILCANGLLQRVGDSPFLFRQDSNFWYLTGINLEDLILVLTTESEYLILPEREAVRDVFDGAIDKEELSAVSGIATIYDHHEGWEKLTILLKKHQSVNVCQHKSYDDRHNLYLNPAKPRLIRWLKRVQPTLEFNDIRLTLAHMRMVKQPEELRALQKAIDITIEGMSAIFKDSWYRRYKTENALNARLTYEYATRGAGLAFPSIVAGGKRACTLHNVENNQPISTDELVVVDTGAEYQNYAADITRVFTPDALSSQQKAVYAAVKEAQDYVFSLLKPGADIRDINAKVGTHIGRFLKAQKLTKTLKPADVHRYFPHAVSHHLGLDVHDAADYSLPLTEGMVITVEPGIYIPQWSIGVRIEDDVLITQNGYKNLSAGLPS